MATTVVEYSKISPPVDSPPEFSLPLVFFDMLWYDVLETKNVIFFEFACSKSNFFNTIVPDLKKSLSLTLGYFIPLAGNIIHPLNPTRDHKPILHYKSADSVSFMICESSTDLNNLTGNHPRDNDEFYAFAPHLPRATRWQDSISCPVLALQATLFAGKGVCVGITTHHAVADASTFVSFIQAWAHVNKSIHDNNNNNNLAPPDNYLPFLDRKQIRNLHALDLDSIYWHWIAKLCLRAEPQQVKLPTNRVRATFVLKKEEIQKLKNLILGEYPANEVPHLSSFTVATALVWVCSAKSAGTGGEEVADDEPEYFGFLADCRGRLKPPLPANYLGNCLGFVRAVLSHGVVKGADGFAMAVVAIGNAIKEVVYNDKGILYGAENWPEHRKLIGKRHIGVTGSPKFNFYNADYGWGKPKKHEALFIDGDGVTLVYLGKSMKFGGGLEISLSLTKVEMDVFSTTFGKLLTDMLQY